MLIKPGTGGTVHSLCFFIFDDADHFSFEFTAGQHHQTATALAFNFDISAHTHDLPVVTAAGMLLFHFYDISQVKNLSFHSSPPNQEGNLPIALSSIQESPP